MPSIVIIAGTAMTPNDRPPAGPRWERPAGRSAAVHWRWTSDDPVATEVVRAVSAAAGRRPDRMEPLYRTIDPDALNRIFPPTGEGSAVADVVISFRYADHDVTVRSDGLITVTPPSNTDR